MKAGKAENEMQHNELPRILYLSNVPVELSSAGATLMYRLFEHYPKDRLQIIQPLPFGEEHPRIPGVQYHLFRSKLDRLRYTRFAKYTKSLQLLSELMNAAKIKKIIRYYNPDVIVTVTINLMWYNAFLFSKKINKPLYVILHDDWLTTEHHGSWQKYLVGMFGKMYRHASERFCISPNMEKYYFSKFGVHGKVLYPSRGKNDHLFPLVPADKKQQPLKFCYAGSLFTFDFVPMLDSVAKCIAEHSGELHIFSNWTKEMLTQFPNLNQEHVVVHPFMHSSELMKKMNAEMDVAILLNSFKTEEVFKYNFSSKIVDYISAGLPVMFWGPASAGSGDWALSIGYKAIVTEPDEVKLAALVKDFHDDDKRSAWAKQIRQAGVDEFSYEKNYNTFIDAIQVTAMKQ